jgi:type II secretory pathway pseudopilin PulG
VNSQRRGFSLIEAMLGMLLVLTLLGMVSTLMREYSDAARFAAAKDNTFDGIQFALNEMANEVGSAVRFLTPSELAGPMTTSTVLTFQRIDPALQRFPEETTLTDDPSNYDVDGDPLPWITRQPAEWMTIDYRKSGAGLVRTATPAGGAAQSQVMVANMNSLLITVLPTASSSRYLQIDMAFQEEKGRLRTFQVTARRWVL